MPAIIADSTITALTSIAASTAGANLPNSARQTSGSSPFVRAPTSSRTAVSTNISAPQAIGTTADGDIPKYAAISCPLAYPAPIIVPVFIITATTVRFIPVLLYLRALLYRSGKRTQKAAGARLNGAAAPTKT